MADYDFVEIGSSGLRRSGGYINEEFLPSLQGIKGFKVYREMSDNDPTIGAMLYAIEKVVTRLEWRVEGDPTPWLRTNSHAIRQPVE